MNPRSFSIDGSQPWWKQTWFLGCLLVGAIFLAYLPAWNGQILWDDGDHLTPPGLRSIEGLKRIWTEPGATMQYYPLTHSIFWVAYHLWGLKTPGYHLLNFSLHSLAALLFLGILRRLNVPGAWLGVILFALHPMAVESVAWITELKNTLSAALFLGSMLAYLKFDRDRNRGAYAFALGLFLLGLAAKTTVICLPVILLTVFWWQKGRLNWKKDILPVVPFFVIGLAAGLCTVWVERQFIGAVGEEYQFTFVERCLIAGRAFWFYLGKLVWPANLAFIYPRWSVSQSVWWQYLFPTALIVLGCALWNLQGKSRAPLAAMICFLAALFPALGFFNVYPFRYSFVADHFQYLACLWPLAAAGALLARFGAAVGKRSALAMWGVLGATLWLLSFQQAAVYSNLETLWTATLAKNPRCWLAYEHLGAIRAEQGRLEEAISNMRKAVEINPQSITARADLGEYLRCANRLDEAIDELQKALAIKPDDPNVHYNLGGVYYQQGRSELAIEHFHQSLKHLPDRADVHNNLGAAYLSGGFPEQAVAEFHEALRLDPDSVLAQSNLAWILATCSNDSVRNGAEALALADRANRMSGGGDPMMLRTLAAALAECGKFDVAIRCAQHALSRADDGLATALQEHIRFYQSGRPWREGSNSGR